MMFKINFLQLFTLGLLTGLSGGCGHNHVVRLCYCGVSMICSESDYLTQHVKECDVVIIIIVKEIRKP